MIEVEVKCTLTPETQLKLQELLPYMQFSRRFLNQDIYYDTPQMDLLQQAVFVRVRNDHLLQFKFNEQADKKHTTSIERSFPLYNGFDGIENMNKLFTRFLPHWFDASSLSEAIHKNNFIELARIHNMREQYRHNNMILSIDHVKELGDFLEVETHHDEGTDTTISQTELQSFISRLGLQSLKIGYVELWLRIHNPQAYQLGKYL